MTTMADTLRRAGDVLYVTEDLRAFLDAVEALGRDPDRINSPEGRAFLEETAPLLARAQAPLTDYIWECAAFARNAYNWTRDGWFSLCRRRSRVEFVRELYRDLVEAEWDVWFMDVEELDMCVRNAGDDEGGLDPTQIPTGTPRSHWWWWYPQLLSGERKRLED